MTVFRVNIERDVPNVVKKLDLKKQDPQLYKLMAEWCDTSLAFSEMLRKHGDRVIKKSRAVYKATDSHLKEMTKSGKASKEDIAMVKDLRKQSYDLTMHIKKNMVPY